MSISLKKGQKISLKKEAGDHQMFAIGLGWDPNDGTGADFDLDASAFICKYVDGKPVLLDDPTPDATSFVFYNNDTSACGGVIHKGDNRTGGGGGDDEIILINLAKVDPTAEEIAFIVTIDEFAARGQNFGQVRNAYIRIAKASIGGDGKLVIGDEVARYDLSEDFSVESAVQFGSLYKNAGEWKFNPIGKGFENFGLAEFVRYYGPNVAIDD